MKTYKLWLHSKTSNNSKDAQDILLNPKEFPDIKRGNIVEIYQPDGDYSRLLLQVKQFKEECPQKEAVSIEQSIAGVFHLRNKSDIYVNKVNREDVSLDLVELLFKEQYFSRSDMYRMWNSLIGDCVYLNKKVEFTEMRAEVIELWSKGDKVACGVVSETTRVVYRSSTAVVQIFIQMSSEMWDFDISGDLYFEKAVNGFLTDLFLKWKEQNCCHDVTIVLFSRTFYDAQSLEEFPEYLQGCLQVDYKGRIYEDYYRVVVQNERYMYEEWSNTLRDLRILFNKYSDRVLNYHRKHKRIPKGYNSTAAQGNFLETLNMSLNLFENYYMDRNFDRTGKVSVVITPGPGVFEVDRELTNITKQRTIDCGVGSDLVCMGEQPLHAAPLFKFHSKDAQTTIEIGDDYNIPHWMNHSFYISKNQIENFKNLSFIPRIKPPQEYLDLLAEKPQGRVLRTPSNFGDNDDNFPFVEYNEYDSQVFKIPARNNPRILNEVDEIQGKCSSFYHGNRQKHKSKTLPNYRQNSRTRTRYRSDDFEGLNTSDKVKKNKTTTTTTSPSSAICIPHGSLGEDLSSSIGCYPIIERRISRGSIDSSDSEETHFGRRAIVGSAGSPIGYNRRSMENYRPRRALINPFAPSKMQFKMTSNMRRWVHAFPKDPKGAAVQPHIMKGFFGYQEEEENAWTTPTKEVLQGAQRAVEARRQRSISRQGSIDPDLLSNDAYSVNVNLSPNHSQHNMTDGLGSSLSTNQDHGNRNKSGTKVREKLYLDSRPVGDQEWHPYMTTGWDWRPLDQREEMKAVSQLMKPILTTELHSQNSCTGISVDWKSLTTPASLPITTDFFPDSHSLDYDYVVSNYNLLPDDINSDYWIKPASTEDEKFYRQEPITTIQVFKELVNQRLAEGFQLISNPPKDSVSQSDHGMGSSPQYQHTSSLIRARPRLEHQEEYCLSIGRIFHKLTLCGPTITVTRYRPRHSQPQHHYKYRYRFQCPDSYHYDVSWTQFSNEKLENYNWNYLDQYICTRGEGDYDLMESLKFWRSRLFLIPCNNQATKKIIESMASSKSRCDIYEEKSLAESKQQISGFIRFLEVANKIKRTTQTRKCRVTVPQDGSNTTPESSPNKPEQERQVNKEEININSSSVKLLEAMTDAQTGLGFLPKQPGIQEKCFLSGEASLWCIQNIHGIKTIPQTTQLMQKLIDDQLIIHASGNPKHRFIYGFYIYMVVTPTSRQKTQDLNLESGQPYNMFFQNEFCEVAVMHPPEEEEEEDHQKNSFYLRDEENNASNETEDWRVLSGLTCQDRQQHVGKVNLCEVKATKHYKFVNVDVDLARKSERLEWATARYHAYYCPDSAFELQVQWMVATGCILGELVYGWTRKSVSCGFHLLPVPVDPFALPNSPNSDPLRGPVFIPLKIECLADCDLDIFHDQQEKLLQFQQAIIKRYGFLSAGVYSSGYSELKQYVHCTGGMFVIIPDYQLLSPKTDQTTYSTGFIKKSSSDMCNDYIARQGEPKQEKRETGFLWSWNFMLSKRWRSTNTGDEHFQNKMLADFRCFCSNSENRLEEFWEDYKLNY